MSASPIYAAHKLQPFIIAGFLNIILDIQRRREITERIEQLIFLRPFVISTQNMQTVESHALFYN